MSKEIIRMKCEKENSSFQFNRMLYGIFIENLGRCLYDGLLAAPDSKLETVCGMRKDILDALKRLQIGIVRVPGGDYADNYHWMDGIGPLEERPKRANGNWKMIDPNRFGTHEFIALCRYLEAEPHFVLNLGTGSVEEARAWLEYCNYPGGTELTDLRAKNGSKEPFGVKYWSIGNEAFNRGGLMRSGHYGDLYRNYAYFMRMMDPNVELVMCGGLAGAPDNWNEEVLEIVAKGHRPPTPEHVSLHAYWPWQDTHSQGYSDEEYYFVLHGLEEMRERLLKEAEICAAYSTKEQKIRLSIDEWAPWYDSTKEPLLEQHITMRDAVITARMLQYVAKMGDSVSMLYASVTINALLALIITKGDEMVLTPAYYAYLLLSEHMDGEIRKDIQETAFTTGCKEWEIPFVTALVTEKEDRTVVSLVNASLTEDTEVEIWLDEIMGVGSGDSLAGKVKLAKLIKLESEDIHDENLPGQPECISPVYEEISVQDRKIVMKLKAHSVYCVVLLPESK